MQTSFDVVNLPLRDYEEHCVATDDSKKTAKFQLKLRCQGFISLTSQFQTVMQFATNWLSLSIDVGVLVNGIVVNFVSLKQAFQVVPRHSP